MGYLVNSTIPNVLESYIPILHSNKLHPFEFMFR